MKKFKTHMVLWAEPGEGFATVCGINDSCSDRFKDDAELAGFSDTKKTTCKKCLAKYQSSVKKHDEDLKKLGLNP